MRFNQNQQNFDPINVGETKHPDRKKRKKPHHALQPEFYFMQIKKKNETFCPLKVF